LGRAKNYLPSGRKEGEREREREREREKSGSALKHFPEEHLAAASGLPYVFFFFFDTECRRVYTCDFENDYVYDFLHKLSSN
jgi:hypothetical protein